MKVSRPSVSAPIGSLIDESLFSATKEDQEKFSFSIVLPEAELKNFKEGDMIEVVLKPAP
jgi:hypothetical protein